MTVKGLIREALRKRLAKHLERRPLQREFRLTFQRDSDETKIDVVVGQVRLKGRWRLLSAQLVGYQELLQTFVKECSAAHRAKRDGPTPREYLTRVGLAIASEAKRGRLHEAHFGGGAYA